VCAATGRLGASHGKTEYSYNHSWYSSTLTTSMGSSPLAARLPDAHPECPGIRDSSRNTAAASGEYVPASGQSGPLQGVYRKHSAMCSSGGKAECYRRGGGRLHCMQREDLQPVFSFKLRGAYNKIVGLPQDQLDRGVVACSAGNHAQVGLHCPTEPLLGGDDPHELPPPIAPRRGWRCRLPRTTSGPSSSCRSPRRRSR
jgi:hypothetical protein